ncbi:MAG TPA: hydroxyisourate hydrolase [Vicinamibacterales bacterium]|nr:hydroxyisourate hydrolase [Vicinamibacterales bacterium]
MSAITTHVLDTSLGRPAAGVSVVLDRGGDAGQWQLVGRGQTDADGRLRTLMPADAPLTPGPYRLVFDTGKYFELRGIRPFHPSIVILFEVVAGEAHYHVPLLISAFGYTTYRGS